MGLPFDGAKWKDAVVLSAFWSGAPGRSGLMALAILETARETQFWQWDDEVYKRPKLLAWYRGKYDLRKASRAISSIEEGGACACALSDIAVRGEAGWRAALLAVAWYRDGENECIAPPLPSILATLSDDDLSSLFQERGSLGDGELIELSYRIGELPEGTSSALQLLKKAIAALDQCETEQREVVLDNIDVEAKEWARSERQRKLAPFSDQYDRSIRLKEFEFLSEDGRRAEFAQRAARFRAELDHSIYVKGSLSAKAQKALSTETYASLKPSVTLDDSFTQEELEDMTNYPPPFSLAIRGRILRAWARADPLPSRFGHCAPQSISSSDPFRFLGWLLPTDAKALLTELKAIDPEAARAAVERILRIAHPHAQRLATPGSFSGMHAGMGRALSSSIAGTGRKVQRAAIACGLLYDSALQIPDL